MTTTEGTTMSDVCFHRVDVHGGSCLSASRNCACKVVYVDCFGRGWCKRHQPDEETRERWNKIADAVHRDPRFIKGCT
jgi:hypothetical protein